MSALPPTADLDRPPICAPVRLKLLGGGYAAGADSAGFEVGLRALRRARIFSATMPSLIAPVRSGFGVVCGVGSSVARVLFQRLSAVARASRPSLDHHSASFRARWTS